MSDEKEVKCSNTDHEYCGHCLTCLTCTNAALGNHCDEIADLKALCVNLREFVTFQECSTWRSNMLDAIAELIDKGDSNE